VDEVIYIIEALIIIGIVVYELIMGHFAGEEPLDTDVVVADLQEMAEEPQINREGG